jgi:hypothetical protein
MSLGLLVYGDNHLILRGPRPTAAEALDLAAQFGLSFARIASPKPSRWTISTREFREDLRWAAVLPADSPQTTAIRQLLDELAARGIDSVPQPKPQPMKETSCAV